LAEEQIWVLKNGGESRSEIVA